jgi:hypothetical protein
MKTYRPPPDNSNLLLAALPAADYARIAPSLTVVPLKIKNILHKPGERIQYVYFPGGGFCSMLAMLEGGDMAQDRMASDDFPLTQEFVAMMQHRANGTGPRRPCSPL